MQTLTLTPQLRPAANRQMSVTSPQVSVPLIGGSAMVPHAAVGGWRAGDMVLTMSPEFRLA